MRWNCAYNHSNWLRPLTAYTAQSGWHGISRIKQTNNKEWVSGKAAQNHKRDDNNTSQLR